jgi:serine/threonine-protein kinase
MADVFLAMAQGPGAFNKLVVVKRLRRITDTDGRHVLMFMDEAKLSARMNHPNIVQTYEVGSDQGDYFIVMEYLEGQTLKHVVRAVSQGAHGAAAFRRGTWLRIVAEMLRGLHYAHELRDFDGAPLGIVHRDVSPHNIFITYDGAVKLVDFGVAKATVNSTHTESGIYKGKLTYMSPEQVTAGKTVDRRADIFAAGGPTSSRRASCSGSSSPGGACSRGIR